MADIELVIKIPEEVYEHILKAKSVPDVLGIDMVNTINAVKNSTPLPKGHGRLIDADAFIATMENTSKRQNYKKLLIDDSLTVDDVFKAVIKSLQNKGLAEGHSPTIIEADKVESEE